MVRIRFPPGMSLRTSGPRGPTTPRPITLRLLPASPTGGWRSGRAAAPPVNLQQRKYYGQADTAGQCQKKRKWPALFGKG